MSTILHIIIAIVALILIGLILIQHSEGGGLGIGGQQGGSSFMTGRGAATFLTRATGVIAAIFMGLCLTLAIINKGSTGHTGHDILAQPPLTSQATPVNTPMPQAAK